jgi:hypothetical protein
MCLHRIEEWYYRCGGSYFPVWGMGPWGRANLSSSLRVVFVRPICSASSLAIS